MKPNRALLTPCPVALRFAGGRVQFVQGVVVGHFVVHRQTGGGGGYRISHVPTGLAIATGFKKFKKAYDCAGEIERLRPNWATMTREQFDEVLRREVLALLEKFDALLPMNRHGVATDAQRQPLLNGYRTQ